MALNDDAARLEFQRISSTVKTLINNDLKTVCRGEGLTVTGVKAALQSRILERLRDLQGSGDYPRFYDLCSRIRQHSTINSSQPYHATQTFYSTQGHGPVNSSYPAPGSSVTAGYGSMSPRIQFPDSPFYTVTQSLTNVIDMPVAIATRQTVQTSLLLTQVQADALRGDSNMRILLYCSGSPQGPQPNDIAFPPQVEIKVNGEAYTGNTRGIKKRPGTTRPADITAFVRKQTGYSNSIVVTYAATDKRFAFVINLVRKHPPEELVDRIKHGHVLSKKQVLDEMISKANDPDVVATSSVMSLRCPISAMRMQLPCRSTLCNHVQCFDATSFLQAQEQAPQWTCPTCSKKFAFGALVIDQYVQDILKSTSDSVDQVTIEPTGNWRSGSNSDEFRKPDSACKPRLRDSGSDDIMEISDHRSNGIKNEGPLTPQSFTRPSTFSSREPSSAPSRTAHSTGSKRATDDVIDLTLSDEDEPPRPVKRQSTGNLLVPRQSVSAHDHSPYVGMPYNAPSYSDYNSNSGAQRYAFSMPQRTLSNQNIQHSYMNYGTGYGLPGKRF